MPFPTGALAIIKAAGPYIASAAGALASNYLGQQNAATAWERSQEGAQWAYNNWRHRYQDTVADMKAAGLNPILAASGGFNISGAGGQQPQPQMAPTPQVNFSSSARDMAEANKAIAEKAKINEETKHEVEKALKTIEETARLRDSKGIMTETEKKLIKEIEVLGKEVLKIHEERYKLASETENNRMTHGILMEKSKQMQAITKQLKLSLKELETESEVYSTSAGQTLKWIERFMDSANIHIGFGSLTKQE